MLIHFSPICGIMMVEKELTNFHNLLRISNCFVLPLPSNDISAYYNLKPTYIIVLFWELLYFCCDYYDV